MREIESKKLFNIFIFVLLFFYLFVHICYLFRPSSNSRDAVTGYYEEKENTLDVVYVGGSACYVFWQGMEAWKQNGIPSYAFGFDSMPAEALEPAVKEVFKTQKPSLLILDIKPFLYRDYWSPTDAAIRNFTDNINYSQERNNFISELDLSDVKNANNRIDYFLDVSKYHSNWTLLNEKSWKLLDNKDENFNKGNLLLTKILPVNDTDFTGNEKIKEPADYVKNQFEDLLNYLKTKKCNVLFVANVYSEQEEERERFNYLKIQIENSGFDFLNCNDYDKNININFNTDFYNENHINLFGAQKYTKFLSEFIAVKYNLPDRRGQNEYSDWNDKIIVWDNELKIRKEETLKN